MGNEGYRDAVAVAARAVVGRGAGRDGASGVRRRSVVLKGVAAFQEGSIYAQKFEQYIKTVNEKGKGQDPHPVPGWRAQGHACCSNVGKNLKDGVIRYRHYLERLLRQRATRGRGDES
jgi:hypothetical protein